MNRSTARRRLRPAGPVVLAMVVALCTACGGGASRSVATIVPSTAKQSTTQSTRASEPQATTGPSTQPTTTPTPSTKATTSTPGSRTTTRRTSSPPATSVAAPTATRRPTGSRTDASPSRSTAATANPARCRAGQVRAAIAEDDAGAGQRYATLTLSNGGSTRCTVDGYARLQLLSASGAAVPTKVVPSGPAGPVTLRPGARAAEQLHWSTVPGPGDPSADRCPATPSRVRVTPGGDAGPVTVAWNLGPVCGGGRIDAEPLRVG